MLFFLLFQLSSYSVADPLWSVSKVSFVDATYLCPEMGDARPFLGQFVGSDVSKLIW
jgi:hypothetical protein